MRVVRAEGSHEAVGYGLGSRLREAIKHNVALRQQKVRAGRMDVGELSRHARKFADLSGPSSLRLMEGLSRGSGLPFREILHFNALQDILSPEGCTSFAAVGKATPRGDVIFLKNRDAPSKDIFEGDRYFKHREINVAQVLKYEDGNIIVGVTIAGLAGLMMGLNAYGVATASNFGQSQHYTTDYSRVDPEYGASGRTQLMREGLEKERVTDAVKNTLGRLTDASMSTPGMLWFMDAKNIYVIEGSYGALALQHVTEGVVARANQFLLLEKQEDSRVISSFCRYARAKQLLEENSGALDRVKMMEFSMDHQNGPGPNSICKHSGGEERSATESAAVMELNGKDPKKSRISIALGSPCRAWRSQTGSFTFRMDQDPEAIPRGFLDGTAFKEHFKDAPYVGSQG